MKTLSILKEVATQLVCSEKSTFHVLPFLKYQKIFLRWASAPADLSTQSSLRMNTQMNIITAESDAAV